MGFNGCWVAVKDKSVKDLSVLIGFEAVPESSISHPMEVVHSAGEASGWGFVVTTDFEDRLLNEKLLRQLSSDTRLIVCMVCESTMCASSEFWASGQRVWSIAHDSQTGNLTHLDVEGERLPKSLENYRAKAIAKQGDDVDVDHMFDVPLYVAREMTGFKHDDELPKGALFQEIRLPQKMAAKPWWKFW